MSKNRAEELRGLFKVYGRRSGYFKKTQKYEEKISPDKREPTKEELDAIANEDRYCLHWGCEKVYRKIENEGKTPCCFHPGKWDFGNTGQTITQSLEDKSTILWKPHWTCCRKTWKANGCTRGIHSGPPLSEYGGSVKKYKWPDYRAQIYFKKHISEHWKQFLNDQVLKYFRPVEEVFNSFAATKGTDGVFL